MEKITFDQSIGFRNRVMFACDLFQLFKSACLNNDGTIILNVSMASMNDFVILNLRLESSNMFDECK